MFIIRIGLSLAVPALLIGCAGLPDRGREEVAATLEARGTDASQAGDATAAKALQAELAGKPLGAADVVRLALVNNPGLRAQYAELGIAGAEVYDAGRVGNPTLSASILFPSGSDTGNETTFGLAHAFTDLLLIGARKRLAQGEYERAKLLAGSAVLSLAADAEAAYYRLVSAQQAARMRQAIAKAGALSADLARRLLEAGNITRLELAREQAAASQAHLDALQARKEVGAARADLAGILGLRGADWSVIERLSTPAGTEDALADLMAQAEQSRLDLAAARKQVALLADAVGISRRFRFLGEVELGVETSREGDGKRLTGPTLALQLPLFNQGKGAVARSKARLQQAEADLAALEVDIAAGIRRAHAELQSARERVEHYRTALIPQREEIVARTQERVNFMLVGQFELLAAKQEEYDAYQGYLEAVRDYWLARTELTRQVGAPLPSSARIGPGTVDVDSLIAPIAPVMDHRVPMQGHENPTGMERHVPNAAPDKSDGPAPKTHQHGDHR